LRTPASWWRIVKWGILAATLAGLGFYSFSHIEDFRVISNIGPAAILWLVLIQIFTLVVMAVRSHAVMRFLGLEISMAKWLRVLIFARFLNRFIPQSGNIYRATVLKMEHGFLIRNYISGYSAYIMLWWLCAACYTIVTMLVLEPGLRISGCLVVPILALFVALFIVGIYVVTRLSSSGKDVLRRCGGVPVAINETLQSMIACLKNPRLIASIAMWGVLSFTFSAAANWICFAGLGSFPGLSRIVAYNFISGTFSFITLTPGNIGITEGAYGLISGGMDEPAATGILVALILRVAGFISLLLLGGALGGADLIKKLRTPT
jgi:uncharacterized membrane protein YbhN (UPF0104 family)